MVKEKDNLNNFGKKEKNSTTPTIKEQEILFGKDGLRRYYKKIIKILKEYIDLEEKYYSLVALWIIGTYLHKQFPAFPYLFFNAMKGSGKTRMLKLISNLARNGNLVGSMTEAVLFRTASQRTLCIDELEGINSRGNENLKLLLNSAYKKGLKVARMKKTRNKEGETQEIEEFEVYSPIALANIWGLDNTLSDRCLSIILERSNIHRITKLIENFEFDMEIKKIKGGLLRLTENIKPELNLFGSIYTKWNSYIQQSVNSVSNVISVSSVNNVNNNNNKNKKEISKGKCDTYDTYDTMTLVFQEISKTDLSGRDLELLFPLFLIADICEVLPDILITAKEIVKDRKQADRQENRDVQLYEFIAQIDNTDFIGVSYLVEMYKNYLGIDEKWLNSTYLGRGFRRLKLVLDERRTGKQRQVKLNIEKARQKLLMFKEPEEIQKIVTEKIDFSKTGIKEKLEHG